MNTEVKKIADSLKEVLSGEPWYGKAALTLLNEVKPETVFKKYNDKSHSIIDLIYHIVTWLEFTRKRLEKNQSENMDALEALNWRETNTQLHTWNNGISQFTSETNKIIAILNNATDEFLEGKVDYREYNFRYLLNGLIQHTIYHLGQIAFINKMY